MVAGAVWVLGRMDTGIRRSCVVVRLGVLWYERQALYWYGSEGSYVFDYMDEGRRKGRQALAKKSYPGPNSFFQFFIFPTPNQDFDFSEFFSWSRLPILTSSFASNRTLILSSWSSMVLANSWSFIIVPLILGGFGILQVQFLPWLHS